MTRPVPAAAVVFGLLCLPSVDTSGSKQSRKGSTVKKVNAMSEQEQTALALGTAPAYISKDAGVMIYGADGKLTEVRKSTNGFTCIPTVMNLPDPDPMCADAAAQQWLNDISSNAPKLGNTVPGIAYMARGGSHFEKDGKGVMSEDGAKVVNDPLHWMVMRPFDVAPTKLPTRPNPSGASIMFEGSPYAHLMSYQDPNKMT